MICYICNKEFENWREHVQDHPMQYMVFRSYYEDNCDWMSMNGMRQDGDIQNGRVRFYRSMQKSPLLAIDELKAKKPVGEGIEHIRLNPATVYDHVYLTAVRVIDTATLVDRYVSNYNQFLCRMCSNYDKKLTCPSRIMTAERFKSYAMRYKYFVYFAMQGNKTVAQTKNYYSKGMLGFDVSMAYSMVRMLSDLASAGRLGDRYRLLFGGRCIFCAPSNKCRGLEGQECKKPKQFLASPEGVGIDLYKMTLDFGIPFMLVPVEFLSKIGGALVDDYSKVGKEYDLCK